MIDDYKPRPGSIGERSIAYLREHGRTSANDLADGIDCERTSLHASLNMCVEHKLVVRGGSNVGGTWYALPGDEVARPPKSFSDVMADAAPGDPVEISESRIGDTAFKDVEVKIAPPFAAAPYHEHAEPEKPAVSRTADAVVVPIFGAQQPVDEPPAPADNQVTATRDADDVSRHFECGLFSDGRFVVEVGERIFLLSRPEMEKLFAWVTAFNSVEVPQ